MKPTTRYIVAVVPYGEKQTQAQQTATLARLFIPTERQTIGVWGMDEPEKGFWTTDKRLAFIYAAALGQRAIWAVRWDLSGKPIEGRVLHRCCGDSQDYDTLGKAYRLSGELETNYTYFLGDRITIG